MQAFQAKRQRAEERAVEAREAGLAPAADYLVFSLGGEEFAVPMSAVRYTSAVPRCVPVPFAGPHHLGVTNVRGAIVSVIDLRLKKGLEAPRTSETALVVLEQGEDCMGFVVDSVNRVLTVRALDELKPVAPLEPSGLFSIGGSL
jgi:purine-binding chemotaxis protein CheW